MGVLGINHIAFRTTDPVALRAFYLELTGGEPLKAAAHSSIRIGRTLLVFFASEREYADADPDELAFDVDATGFDTCSRGSPSEIPTAAGSRRPGGLLELTTVAASKRCGA